MASCSVCHFLTRSMFRRRQTRLEGRAPEPVGDSTHARGPGSVSHSITDQLFSVRPAGGHLCTQGHTHVKVLKQEETGPLEKLEEEGVAEASGRPAPDQVGL